MSSAGVGGSNVGLATEAKQVDANGTLPRILLLLKGLARLSYNTAGLRVDGSGATQPVSLTNQTLTTVAGVGYNSQSGQAIQQSRLAFQQGYRRNLVVS